MFNNWGRKALLRNYANFTALDKSNITWGVTQHAATELDVALLQLILNGWQRNLCWVLGDVVSGGYFSSESDKYDAGCGWAKVLLYRSSLFITKIWSIMGWNWPAGKKSVADSHF